jgi:ABC-type polysaccharide/polyol phosphate export permease
MVLNHHDPDPRSTQRIKTPVYHFDLVRHLVRRDFILRYKGSLLGLLWSLGTPLLQLLVLVFLFRKVIQLGIEAYAAYVFVALLPWNWFSTAVGSAGGLFLGNRDLVRRPDFAPFTLVVVHTLSNFLTYLAALPILFILLLIYQRDFTLSLFLLPLLMFIQGILITGLSLIVATANVFYRDVQHMTGIIIMLLFYMTPVFYRVDGVSKGYHFLFLWNPLAVLIEGYRSILFYGRIPPLSSLFFVAVVSCLVAWLGYYIYNRSLHEVVDRI